MESNRITSSFRDPSGYVFSDGDAIKRVIHPIYFKQYDALKESGFYNSLIAKGQLVSHREISRSDSEIILEAEKIPFITYPYEWSFLQYKHAALLTLRIQKLALEKGFSLKDATAFNITFDKGKPVFIDTLSFDFYTEGSPWHAYKQFIMHFLGPLVLSKYFGHDYLKTLSSEIDGVPLKKLSKLLPAKTWMSPTLLTNIHLLAKYDAKYSGNVNEKKQELSKSAQLRLIDSLYNYIKDLQTSDRSEWDKYYSQINYNDDSYRLKKQLTNQWFESFDGDTVIDIGGNDGTFSREFSKEAKFVIVADVDSNAVEQNYRKVIADKETNILPMVADVLNPVSGYGFNNEERFSFIDRVAKAKLSGCMALAVIHHITLSGNIPFSMSAKFFANVAPNLLIEFPGREDSWVKFLLDSKREFRSHFDFYNEQMFETEYAAYFEIVKKEPIDNSARTLYTMVRRK